LSKLIIAGDIVPGDTVTMKYDEENKQIQWDIDDGQPESEEAPKQEAPAPKKAPTPQPGTDKNQEKTEE